MARTPSPGAGAMGLAGLDEAIDPGAAALVGLDRLEGVTIREHPWRPRNISLYRTCGSKAPRPNFPGRRSKRLIGSITARSRSFGRSGRARISSSAVRIGASGLRSS